MDIVRSIRLRLPVALNLSGGATPKVQLLDSEGDLVLTVEEPNLAPLLRDTINSLSPTGRIADVVDAEGVVTTPGYSYIDLYAYPTVTNGAFTKPPIVPVP